MDIAIAPAHELVLTRDLNVPRARAFAAWTDQRQASLWWAPRAFVPLFCEMDVRPGGLWRRRLRAPDGTIVVKHGVYREIVAPERLVFTYVTYDDVDDRTADPETIVTVTFADLGKGRTRLTLRHAAFRTEADRLDHQGGWSGCLDRFAGFIAGARPIEN